MKPVIHSVRQNNKGKAEERWTVRYELNIYEKLFPHVIKLKR